MMPGISFYILASALPNEQRFEYGRTHWQGTGLISIFSRQWGGRWLGWTHSVSHAIMIISPACVSRALSLILFHSLSFFVILSQSSHSLSLCFILYHSVSFCFILSHSDSFCFILARSVSSYLILYHSISFPILCHSLSFCFLLFHSLSGFFMILLAFSAWGGRGGTSPNP